MTTIEERITRALHSHAGEVSLSEADVERLQSGLAEAIHGCPNAPGRGLRPRAVELAVAACAVVGVVLGVFALRDRPTAAPAIKPYSVAELVGLWRVDSEHSRGSLWRITEDGVLRIGATDGRAGDKPSSWVVRPGRHSLVTTSTATGADACVLTWDVQLNRVGTMRAFVTASDGRCSLPVDQDYRLTRVSPYSQASLQLTSLFPEAASKPVGSLADVVGTWLVQGEGTVLTITPDGRYTRETIGLTGTARSGTARVVGPLLVLGGGCDLEYTTEGTTGARVEVFLEFDGCGDSVPGGETWIRLS